MCSERSQFLDQVFSCRGRSQVSGSVRCSSHHAPANTISTEHVGTERSTNRLRRTAQEFPCPTASFLNSSPRSVPGMILNTRRCGSANEFSSPLNGCRVQASVTSASVGASSGLHGASLRAVVISAVGIRKVVFPEPRKLGKSSRFRSREKHSCHPKKSPLRHGPGELWVGPPRRFADLFSQCAMSNRKASSATS